MCPRKAIKTIEVQPQPLKVQPQPLKVQAQPLKLQAQPLKSQAQGGFVPLHRFPVLPSLDVSNSNYLISVSSCCFSA